MRKILGGRRLRAAAAVAAVLTLVSIATQAAPTQAEASAEPDRTATLNRANPKFTWESSGSGAPDPTWDGSGDSPFRCTGGPFRCEYILLLVEKTGKLTLTLDGTDMDSTSEVTSGKDIDGYMYKSNAAGDPRGQTLTRDCATHSSTERCKAAVGPGFYVVEVEYYAALEAHYIGTAELAPLRRGRRPPSRRG